MKVRIITSVCGLGFSYAPKNIVEMPDATAKDWIKRGMAVAAEESENVDFTYKVPETKTKETTNDNGGNGTPLPEDFPVKDWLEENGYDTIEKVKACEDLTVIKGIGEKTAESILSCLAEL